MNRPREKHRASNRHRTRICLLAVMLLALASACAQQISSNVTTPLSAQNRARIRRALLLTAWRKPSNPNDFRTCIGSAEELTEFVDTELEPAESVQQAILQRFSTSPTPFRLVTDAPATALFRQDLGNRREALSEIAGLMRSRSLSDALAVVVEPQITCRIVLAQQAGPIVPASRQRHTVDIAATSELIALKTQATLYKSIDRGRRGREIQLANLRSADSLRNELDAQYVALANQIHRHLSGQP